MVVIIDNFYLCKSDWFFDFVVVVVVDISSVWYNMENG